MVDSKSLLHYIHQRSLAHEEGVALALMYTTYLYTYYLHIAYICYIHQRSLAQEEASVSRSLLSLLIDGRSLLVDSRMLLAHCLHMLHTSALACTRRG